MDRKRVFIHSEDAELAVQLVKLLWQWDACIRQVQGDGSLVD